MCAKRSRTQPGHSSHTTRAHVASAALERARSVLCSQSQGVCRNSHTLNRRAWHESTRGAQAQSQTGTHTRTFVLSERSGRFTPHLQRIAVRKHAPGAFVLRRNSCSHLGEILFCAVSLTHSQAIHTCENMRLHVEASKKNISRCDFTLRDLSLIWQSSCRVTFSVVPCHEEAR